MKNYILLSFFLFGAHNAALAHDIDPANSTYTCQIFEPSPSGGRSAELVVGVSEVVNYALLDNIHRLELHWYHWTLNVSIFNPSNVTEVVGAASHLHLKLRSHVPQVSVYCTNNDLT